MGEYSLALVLFWPWTDSMRLTPLMEGRLFYSVSTNLNVISSKNTFMETIRIMFDRISVHILAQPMTHKHNHHKWQCCSVAVQNMYSTFIGECPVERGWLGNVYLNDTIHFYIQTFFIHGFKDLITSLWFYYNSAKILHIELCSILLYITFKISSFHYIILLI